MSMSFDSKEFLEFFEELNRDKDNIRRVNSFLDSKQVDFSYTLHKKSKSARDAAENLNSSIEEIVKSLVFIGEEPVLVLVQGDKSASEKRIKAELNWNTLRLAGPHEVENITGYRVGTVSPFDVDIKVIIDKSIMELELARPAAGSTCIGVEMDPKDLKEITGAEILEVS